jgi:ABC-type phosphate transport system substrate-binding protein
VGKKMRKYYKSFISILTLSALTSLITACTPPMPPDVLAAVAEQQITCAEGQLNIALDEFNIPVVQSINDLYISSCPNATINFSNDSTTADIVISDGSADGLALCTNPVAQVPVMIESTGVAFNLAGVSGLVLDAKAIEKIYKGEITDWADPVIVELNPEFELTSTPITTIGLSSKTASDQAFSEWMNRLGATEFQNVAKTVFESPLELVEALALTDGAISIMPGSIMSENALSGVSIKTDAGNVAYDLTSITAAGTQATAEITGDIINVSLDPNIAVSAEAGNDEITLPWQAISWVNLAICKADTSNNNNSATARYFLRQDAQGQLSVFGYGALDESLRLSSAGIVGKNLPLPTEIPATE